MDYYDKMIDEKYKDAIHLDDERKECENELKELKETLLLIDSNVELYESEVENLKQLLIDYKIAPHHIKGVKMASIVYAAIIAMLASIIVSLVSKLPVANVLLTILFLGASSSAAMGLWATVMNKHYKNILRKYNINELEMDLNNKKAQLLENKEAKKVYEDSIANLETKIDNLLRATLDTNRELRILKNYDLLAHEEIESKEHVKRKIK